MPKHVVDLLIENDGDLIGIVEVKRWRNPNRQTAEEILPHLIDYESLEDIPAPYLMLFTPTLGYLWKRPGRTNQQFFEFDTSEILLRYVPDPNVRNSLLENELSLVALQWLHYLSWKRDQSFGEAEKVLEQAGFIKAIEEAITLIEVPIYAGVR